jgi:hypothetical protein
MAARRRLPGYAIAVLALLIALLAPLNVSASTDPVALLSLALQSDGQEIEPEWEDAGVTGPGEYESPQFGHTLEWEDPWTITDATDTPVISDTEGQQDLIFLTSEEDSANLRISFDSFENFGYDTPDAANEEYIGYWETQTETGGTGGMFGVESVEALLTDFDDDMAAAVVLIVPATGDERVAYFHQLVEDNGDTIIRYDLNTPLDTFASLYETAGETLTLNGDPMFAGFDLADVEAAIDDIDGSAGDDEADGTDDEADSADDDRTDDGAGNGGDYLAEVRDHADELNESLQRFDEILRQGEFTDADIEELLEILDAWTTAPDVAAELEPGNATEEEIHEVYLDYTDTLAEAAAAFTAFLSAEEDSPELDQALDDFAEATADAATLYEELDELLSDAE